MIARMLSTQLSVSTVTSSRASKQGMTPPTSRLDLPKSIKAIQAINPLETGAQGDLT